MFVIFPADELILMTYGPAIPRLAPRPTLDRLREPEVPIEIPLRSLSPPLPSVIATTTDTNKTTTNSSAVTAVATNSSRTAASQGVNSSNVSSANTTAPAHNSSASRSLNSGASAAAPVFTTAFTYDPSQPAQTTSQLLASNSLPPTPTRRNSRTSRTSLTHSASAVPAPDAAISKRSSVRSNRSNRSAHQQTPPSATQLQHQQQLLLLQHKQQQEYQHQQLLLQQQHQQEEQLLRHLQIQKHNNTSKRSNNSATTSQMQNDATDSSRSMQGRQVGPRPTLERSTAIRGATPQHGLTPQRGATPQLSCETEQLDEYAGATSLGGGGEQLISARDRSPNVFLEPPSPDPTQIIYGPGWGRPMSPMDLPPEPRPKSPTPSKSSRLRPKLHLPLGRLGRSTSTDQRESNRLKEDLQLLVDNPVFNCENLRQRNFDAFFESGEPKYKLQPMTPNSAPTGSLSSASSQYSPQIDGRSTKSAGGGGGGGGLFAPTPNEGKTAMNSRSRSTEQPVSPNRERRAASVSSGVVPQKDSSTKSSSGRKSRRFFGWRGPRSGSLGPRAGMASYNGVLKDYGHSSLNEAFKSQNNVNFKLIKTVSDFTETLSHLYEEHATALQSLVSNFRKKNAELRKERPACHQAIFQAWETFLQEVESDSQASNDVANVLSRQVSRPMLDKSFHRKVQSRKIFTHRESFETIIAKTEEKLSKCRLDYKQCYLSHRQNPTPLSLTEYIDAHNAYVQQLHATNAMLETYHCETVPQLMQELEEIHNDLCGIIAESIQQGADVIANKASDQAKRYGSLTAQCSAVSPMQDLTSFVRILPPLPTQVQKVPKRMFAPPQLPAEVEDNGDFNEMAPVLRNELVFDRHSTLSLRPALESLKREAHELEMQIRLLQDTVDGLNRTQQRGIEGQLYNKVNELQEELSLKKFDLRAKQLHFAAIKAQKELYASKVDPGSPRAERKLSAATAPSMKTKWLKAFRSLKPASGSAPADRRNGAAGSSSQPLRPNEDGSHHLQEYTYKKITACDVCSQILRGHTRQGLRCRICKLNAHGDCASQLPRCQPKQKLLRRQKSTSELENRVDVEDERPAEEGIRAPTPPPPLALQSKLPQQQQQTLADEENALPASPNANQTIGNRKFRQKVPFIDRIAQLEFTDIDQIYRVIKQTGELKSANIAASTTGTGVVAASADKSVQGSSKPDGPDIQIVNVPDYPERTGIIGGPGSSSSTGGLSAIAATAVAAAQRAGRGVRPPPVPVPILGVQLQQQELAQQRSGGLPVPQQDVSSSSDYRLSLGNAAAIQMPPPPSMASLPTSAYISGGLGINYYTATQPPSATLKNNVLAYQQQQQQQQQLLQQQLLQQQALPQPGVAAAAALPATAAATSQPPTAQQPNTADSGTRRRLFAGFRPLSGFGRLRSRSSQHRSISLPETPHSPRRQKLNLRMKSLSLDSPESTELHGQIRRRQQPVIGTTTVVGGGSVYYHGGSGGHLEHNTPPSNNSRLHSPSSPSHQGRKLLYATRGMRGGSVDLPDEMEKSQSSASTSPCPSPVRQFQKSHRLLPTNLYVILYNFKARHADELDLKAGYKVTVIDTSDPDWWQGKLLGRVGYFPSKYCVRLNANEKPLQVTHNLQVSDGERGESMTLLRDQIVIQTGDEVNGMVMVRSADNRQGYCPVKYLQEV